MSVIQFDLGETRYVEILVSSRDGSSFDISSAQYEVLKKDGTVEQEKTDAVIEEHVVSGLVTPLTKSRYIVKFYFVIGAETYIHAIKIDVQ